MADEFPAAQRHSPPQEMFPDAYLVRGSMRMGVGVRIGRNMIVLREGDALTAINAVRLSDAGEAALEALGEVRHIVRLGCFHGLDDRYYVQRYGAQFWCQQDSTRYREPVPDEVLREDGPLPGADLALCAFGTARYPECVLLWRRHGGLLIACDCLQHYPDWRGCSLGARLAMRAMGFRRGTQIGPLWKKAMTPPDGSLEPDFRRLLALDFNHLVGAHGDLRRDDAHAAAEQAVERAYRAS